jgi:hypothetical protein
MSMASTALRIARADGHIAVQERETRTKYLLTLVKGVSRPSRWTMPLAWLRERLGYPVTREWEVMGIYSTGGAARAWAEHCKHRPESHPRDRWQIIPIIEDEGIPRERIWQPEYEVVSKTELAKLINVMR